MFCPKCGVQVPENENVCSQCRNPVGGAKQTPATEINSHIVLAILVTVLCCLPFGIVSIIYAAKVSGLVAAGKIDEAIIASNNAKKWGLIGLIAGLIITLFWVIVQILATVAANA